VKVTSLPILFGTLHAAMHSCMTIFIIIITELSTWAEQIDVVAADKVLRHSCELRNGRVDLMMTISLKQNVDLMLISILRRMLSLECMNYAKESVREMHGKEAGCTYR
jgi:hypothetical protein